MEAKHLIFYRELTNREGNSLGFQIQVNYTPTATFPSIWALHQTVTYSYDKKHLADRFVKEYIKHKHHYTPVTYVLDIEKVYTAYEKIEYAKKV